MMAGQLTLQIYDSEASRWLDAVLDDGQSISIEETSPLWESSSGMFSYSFQLNVERNRHILGNIDHMHGDDVYGVLYGRRFRLIVCGVPFRHGIIRLDSNVEIGDDGTVEMELAAQEKELSEIIDGVNCQDIPVDDGTHKIQIGYSYKEEQTFPFYLSYRTYEYNKVIDTKEYAGNPINVNISMPKAMVPVYYHDDGTVEDFINVQNPYDPSDPMKYPYCNVRLCSQRYVQTSSGWEKDRGYCVGEPDRVNTSPCFYVAYFMYRLWRTEKIDVCVRENQLEDVRDYLRLAMYHTDCQYDEELDSDTSFFASDDRNKVKFGLAIEKKGTYRRYTDTIYSKNGYPFRDVEEYYFTYGDAQNPIKPLPLVGGKWVTPIRSANLMKAYANSDNFPDADVNSLLDCLKTAFCARLLFDSDARTLRIVLMRNVLAGAEVLVLPAKVSSCYVEYSDKRGFRLKYKGSSEIYKNSITKQQVIIGSDEDENGSGVDTTYNYNDYRKLAETSDYADIVQNVNPYDMTTYLHTGTGNAYRIKVDDDASTEEELFPVLFEVGGYADVEVGDCSDDDRVEEVSIGFTPVIPNDVNYEKHITSTGEEPVDVTPKYAQFASVEVHHVQQNGEDVLTKTEEVFDKTLLRLEGYGGENVTNAGFNKKGFLNFKASIHVSMEAVESYDISSGNENPYNADSSSGIVLGIMQGSGADAEMKNMGTDAEGNTTWTYVPGTTSAFTSDSIDYNGNIFDYNGKSEGYEDSDFSSAKYETLAKAAIARLNQSFQLSVSYKKSLVYSGAEVQASYHSHEAYQRNHGYVCPVSYMGNAYTGEFYLIYCPGEYRGSKSMYMYALQKALRATTHTSVVNSLASLYIATFTSSADAEAAVQKWVSLSDLGEDKVQRVSLKLKAERKNPYHGASPANPLLGKTEDPYKDVTDEDGYFPATGELASHRGLYDQFYTEYAHWVINRKTAHVTARVELADILNIDYTKRYRIGDITGFIRKMSYSVSADGLSEVKFELYYL